MSGSYRHAKIPPPPGKSATGKWVWAAAAGAVALLIVAGFILLAQGGQASGEAFTPQVTGGPSAQIDETVFDYGDVKLGKTIKTVFHVKNVGDTQLAFDGEPRVQILEGC